MNKLNRIAFIMDGNGDGEEKRIKTEIQDIMSSNSKKIVETSIKLKILQLPLCLLTENWKRPKTEINFYLI